MAVPRGAWGRSRRTPVPTPHSEGQPPHLATPAVGPLRHLVFGKIVPRSIRVMRLRRPNPIGLIAAQGKEEPSRRLRAAYVGATKHARCAGLTLLEPRFRKL